MNKISITNIRFKAFRSFPTQQDTGPLPASGLVGIRGFNQDTGSSSGSGKSNFHLPISYAFGYCPIFETELQSNLTDERIQVELELDTPKGPAVLKKGEVSSLQFGNSPPILGSKAIQTAIKEMVGMSVDLLDVLTFREQRGRGRFLSMGDKEKKEFLSILLGLEELEPQIEVSVKKANEAEKVMAQHKAIIDALIPQVIPPTPFEPVDTSENEAEIEKLTNKRSLLYNEYVVLVEKIKEYKEKIEEIKDREFLDTYFDDLEQIKTENLITDCNRQIAASEERASVLRKSLTDEYVQLNRAESAYNREAGKLSGVTEQLMSVMRRIKGLQDAQCPTCSQAWAVSEESFKSLEAERAAFELQVKASMYAQEHLPALMAEKEEVNGKLINFKYPELETLKDIKQQLTEKLTSLKAYSISENLKRAAKFNHEKNAEMAKVEEEVIPFIDKHTSISTQMATNSNEITRLSAEVTYKKGTNEAKLDNYNLQLRQFNQISEKIADEQKKYNFHSTIHKEESDFASMLKSFLGAIFEEVLVEIATETNNMLKAIPNVATTTIQFATENVTQKGTVRQEIKPVLQKRGKIVSIKSGLSGGMFSSVELAVDLAIGIVIGRRTGIMPGWLILDESFEGLGAIEKEACLELLKNVSSDRLIFVIDHASELKEYFDKFIDVESYNDVSQLKGLT